MASDKWPRAPRDRWDTGDPRDARDPRHADDPRDAGDPRDVGDPRDTGNRRRYPGQLPGVPGSRPAGQVRSGARQRPAADPRLDRGQPADQRAEDRRGDRRRGDRPRDDRAYPDDTGYGDLGYPGDDQLDGDQAYPSQAYSSQAYSSQAYPSQAYDEPLPDRRADDRRRHDPRQATIHQRGDQWPGDPRDADQWPGDPRDADPRQAEQWPVDPRLADPRLADPRLADPRLADPRLAASSVAADPRLATDPRLLMDPRLSTDPRLITDPRLASNPGPATDPRLITDPRLALGPGPGPDTESQLVPDPRLAPGPGPAIDPRLAATAIPADPRLAPSSGPAPDPRLVASPIPPDPRLAPSSGPAPDPRLTPGPGPAPAPDSRLTPSPGAAPDRLAPSPAPADLRLAATAVPADPRLAPSTAPAPDPRLAPSTAPAPDPRLASPNPPGQAWPIEPLGPTAQPHTAEPAPYPEPPRADLVRQGQPGAELVRSEPVLADLTRTAGQQRRPGENTRAVHLPPPPAPAQQPISPPIYRTAAFAFGSSAEYAAILGDAASGFSYSRIDNPTVEALAAAVASLEGVNLSYQISTQAFASGMAAISTVFWAFTRAGAHVVAPTAVYGGSYGFLRNVAANFGVQTDFVDMTDLSQVQARVRTGTSILFAETLANPTCAVADLAALARIAHEAGALFVVDSTLAPPVICRPLEHGADLVVHSATKYFGGHSDVTGGVVTGHPELIKVIRRLRIDTGGSLAADDAYLMRRGLETLPLRVRRQCATTQVVAAGLAMHPAVRTVYYPGLTSHPGHELARRQFDAGPEGTRFGAIMTVAPYGGYDAGFLFADRLRLARIASSLGGTHTKVSHVASTTHRQMDPVAMSAAGIDPGSVRFSVGLEDGEDLLTDAMAALDSLGRA